MRWKSILRITLLLCATQSSDALPSISRSIELLHGRDLKAVDKFCTLAYHTSNIVDKTLFLVGGQVEYQSPGSDGYDDGPSRRIIKVDLSKSWDATSPAIAGNISMPATSAPDRGCYAALWTGRAGKKLYYYGGDRPETGGLENDALGDTKVYEYNIAGNSWTSRDVDKLPIRGCGSWVQDSEGNGYYLGGLRDADNDPAMNGTTGYLQTGMVSLPLTGGAASIIPTTSLNTYGTQAGGVMVYVDSIGNKGGFVAFGGLSLSPDAQFNWGSDTSSFNDMNQISVFDVESQKWHQQRASGNIRPRIQFCAVVQQAPDKSQTFIYIYGGYNSEYNIDQVDVLSIPAFVWTTATPAGFRARLQHTCNAYNSLMILAGGWMIPVNEDGTRNKDRNKRVCEPENMYRIFDTSTHQWTDKFDTNAAAYTVPSALSKIVGGDAKGGATVQQPAGGFTDPDLQALFKTSSKANTNTTTSASPEKGGKNNKDEPKKSNNGAIAGGIVAGIAAIAVVAGLVWFLVRRRRKDAPKPPVYSHVRFNGSDGGQDFNGQGVQEMESNSSSHGAASYYKPQPAGSPVPIPVQEPVELPGSHAPPVELPAYVKNNRASR